MNTSPKPIASTAVAGLAAGLAALALAGPASADHALLDIPIYVPGCGSPGQTCGVTPTFPVLATDDHVRVHFVHGPGCSVKTFDVIDGQPQPLQLSTSTGDGNEYTVTPGFHTIGVQAIGIPGSCSTGHASYSGKLVVESVAN